MAWYHFHFDFGPGHQGQHDEYCYSSRELSKEEEKDEMHSIAHESSIEDWFCRCDKVEVLPEPVRALKTAHYKALRSHAGGMLKILGVSD